MRRFGGAVRCVPYATSRAVGRSALARSVGGGGWYTVCQGGPVPPGSARSSRGDRSVPLSPSREAGKESPVATDRRGDARRAAAPGRELLSAADVARTVARIAHQIIEKTAFGPDNPTTSCSSASAPAAKPSSARIAAALVGRGNGVAAGRGACLDITLYRDDLSEIGPRPSATKRLRASPTSTSTRRRWSCWWTTCSSPGAPSAPARAVSDFGRPGKSGWPCSSTVAAASCRSAPTRRQERPDLARNQDASSAARDRPPRRGC